YTHDAAAVPQRHGDERFLDQRRALDAVPELAVGSIPDEQRFAAHRALPGHADADPDAQKLERQRDRVGAERAAERNRNELVAVDDEHATVVIVDQGPELGRDLVPDSVHVGEAVELAA